MITDLAQLHPQRVCIIKPSSLGDVVHALPVLAALHDRWPHSHFSWVINQSLTRLVAEHPALDEVIPFDRGSMNGGPRGIANFCRFLYMLRSKRFDLTIDLQGLLRSGLMAAATGAPVRVGLAEAREGSRLFLTHPIKPSPTTTHAVDKLLAVAEALGAAVESPRFVVPISESERTWARQILNATPRPILVLNPGARWLTKRWPPEHFAEIARRAVEHHRVGLVVVGAPEDQPLAAALRVALAGLPLLDLAGKTTLGQLAAVIEASEVFVSNDTGPLHLAAAIGAKTVGIFTCTSPLKTGAYGPKALSARSCVWCAPSFVKTCNRLECMSELSPDRVWPCVQLQLDSSNAGQSAA